MRTELVQARENLKKKLLQNADAVMREIMKSNLNGLAEIGLFGSVAKNNFTCKSDSDIYLLFDNNIPDRQTRTKY